MNRRFRQNTPQSKMIEVNQKFGNTGIKHQQGTSRILYDALPLNVSLEAFTLNFFENVKTRKFPFTNLPENKLQVGETFTIQDYYLSIIVTKKPKVVGGFEVCVAEVPMEFFPNTKGLYRSDMDFMIGENRVIKQLKVGSSFASFNYGANFAVAPLVNGTLTPDVIDPTIAHFKYDANVLGHDVYPLRTDLVIPPDIEFVAPIKFAGLQELPTEYSTETHNYYVMLTIEGSASILAPRTTF